MDYDVLVLGAGSAGMGTALYSYRYNLNTAIIGMESGGLLNEAHMVENYIGFGKIPGRKLMDKFRTHIDSFNIPVIAEWITEIKKIDSGFEVVTDKKSYTAKAIVITLGTEHRRLSIPGEKEFSGKGVSYCFTCDAPFFKGKDAVGIVGGNDSAAMAALLLADFAKKVYILYRKDKIRAEPIQVKLVEAKENIEVIPNVNVTEVLGEVLMNKVKLDNGEEMALNGLFVEIGAIPNTKLAKDLGVELDKSGYIKKDEHSKTSMPGVFTAGDISTTPLKQAIVGAAEGAIAALSAYNYINSLEDK